MRGLLGLAGGFGADRNVLSNKAISGTSGHLITRAFFASLLMLEISGCATVEHISSRRRSFMARSPTRKPHRRCG
jgi:hypothetical protein